MLKTSIDEVESAFRSAKNLNAALKTFLKREGTQGGPTIETFAKGFRNAASAGKPEPIRRFIEANYPKRELHFMAVVRYAHPDVVESIIQKIFEKHAETFNSTYEKTEDSINVTDRKKFDSIITDVFSMIESELKTNEIEATNFMRNAILASIFDTEVLPEVMKLAV